MTKNDEELIKKAHEIPYTEWYKIQELIDKADTEEVKQQLNNISSSLYHKEEYHAGVL